jgi:glycine oxidase
MISDVLIIGGGVIGLSIARELKKRGREVTVVDRSTLGGEASWAAAGMLSPNLETEATKDFHRFGIEALNAYPAFADELLNETAVDIELDRSGTLCLAFSESEEAELAAAYERHIRRGVEVERLTRPALLETEPAISPDVRSALLFPNDWQVENRKVLGALSRFAEQNGIRVVPGSEIEQLLVVGSRVVGAATRSEKFSADSTVIATGAWTSHIKIAESPMPLQIIPIRGQMVSFHTPVRKIKRVVYSPRGYLVPRADGRVLVGATVEDVGFDKSTTAEGISELTEAAFEISPTLREFAIADEWAGLRPFAADGLPVLGDLPGLRGALIATAHYRNGILLAPLTAKIVAEKIVDGTESSYFAAFGADRFSTTANATAK